MNTDPQTLLAQAQCYLCLGVSLSEALQLALLADIVNNTASAPAVLPYKVYSAVLNQSGVAAPVASVMQNTLGPVTFSVFDTGVYNINSAGLFTVGKTMVFFKMGVTPGISPNTLIGSQIELTNASNLKVGAYNVVNADFEDGLIVNAALEIRVYP